MANIICKVIVKKFKRTRVFAFVLMAWTNGVIAQGALLPVNLRCDERVNPLGIGDVIPRLSWQLQSGGTGAAYRRETQNAYEIQAGTTPNVSDLWDSGKVISDKTMDISYGGQPPWTIKNSYSWHSKPAPMVIY